MISNDLEDYEVLSILGADLNSTFYKVKNKTTSEVFVWKAISYEKFSETEKESILSKIEKQKLLNHPHLLKIFGCILHEKTKILYLVSEFCVNGNLSDIIHKCLIDNEYLNEDFLWQTLYQIARAFKIGHTSTSSLNLNNIFLDANYKIKLINNEILNNIKHESGAKSQITCFGSIILDLCTLKPGFSAKTTKEVLIDIPNYYSNELKEIIKFMITASVDFKNMVDAILCHPTVLLKSVKVKKSDVFVKSLITKNEQQNETMVAENVSNAELEATYRLKLENFKNRETALKIREERLGLKAHELHKRERKIALKERMVKEKMLQAELYLKRCRESKSTSTGSSNSKVKSYEHIDTSFSADCGDSTIIVTSNKINQQVVRKPPNFIRAMSERRVRFKGHSPLKDMYNRISANKELRAPQQLTSHYTFKQDERSSISDKSVEENLNHSSANIKEKSDLHKKVTSRKKLDLFSVFPIKSRKPLVDLNSRNSVIPEEKNTNLQQEFARPISWTEESKQHAFDLLRIMNQEGNTEPVRHTYL